MIASAGEPTLPAYAKIVERYDVKEQLSGTEVMKVRSPDNYDVIEVDFQTPGIADGPFTSIMRSKFNTRRNSKKRGAELSKKRQLAEP